MGTARILRPMRRRVSLLLICLLVGACGGRPAGAAEGSVRIALEAPSDLDPARTGDAQSSAIISQLFETLTTFDESLELRPALAESWRVEDDGRRVVFRLRPDLRFSDGSPLHATDVLRSWLRVIDPASPSPLASLLADVRGATAYADGEGATSDVGLTADDGTNEIVVELDRAAADFPAIAASPTLAVVPPGIDRSGRVERRRRVRGERRLPPRVRGRRHHDARGESGVLGRPAGDRHGHGRDRASVVRARSTNSRPATSTTHRSAAPTPRGSPTTRRSDLGCATIPAMSTDFYGFDTTEPPFDDVRVRRAFGAAVDWRRIARLAVDDPAAVATSMVPPGIPDRSDVDRLPDHDPDGARALLAEAGYRNGRGFPPVTLVTGGSPYDEAVVAELERELGVTIDQETMDFGSYFDRLDTDPPQMWFLSWVADYPGRNDFLGVLLRSGSANNYGSWSSPDFDAAIADAGASSDEPRLRSPRSIGPRTSSSVTFRSSR